MSAARTDVAPTPGGERRTAAEAALVVHVVGAVARSGRRAPACGDRASSTRVDGRGRASPRGRPRGAQPRTHRGRRRAGPWSRVRATPVERRAQRAGRARRPGDAPVDLNTADLAALDALPGIGPVLAQRIVDGRATRPFASVDALDDVPGIGPALLADLRDLVRV